MTNVLVLNQGYVPLYVEPWTDSIRKVKKKKAEVLSHIEDHYLQSFKDADRMPVVIRLLYFMYPPNKGVNFSEREGTVPDRPSRHDIWERDKHTCQYCGKALELSDMSWDHVIPQDQGGKNTWYNLVCSCSKCNTKKKNRTPEEANMRLIQKPYIPMNVKRKTSRKRSEVCNFIRKIKEMKNVTGKEWLSYIYMHVPLEE